LKNILKYVKDIFNFILNFEMETILVTWSSWFVWFHLSKRLLENWFHVLWFDNENDYYDVSLKVSRRNILESFPNFRFYHGDLSNLESIEFVFKNNKFDKVINLAAWAWIRHSFKDPLIYVQANIIGFSNLLFLSNKYWIKSYIYGSSSSVYWNNKKTLLSVEDWIDKPISLYAATKRSNELMAYSYSHSFWLQTIWLRFFTVYGPWGRPDMAIFRFAEKIKKGEAIDVYNYWKMRRDFTYVDDIVDWIVKAINYDTKYDLFNLGNHQPIELEYLISLLEENLWKKAIKNYLPLQPWDMLETNADIQYTKDVLWWEPKISIEEGVANFVKWFNDYYW
jgi:UDP-glucuronate 4-epimerase